MATDVVVYRSERKSGAYLYLPAMPAGAGQEQQFDELPAALLEQLGELTEVLRMALDAQRQLANADAGRVLAQLEAVGYYLQMPPLPGVRSDD